MLEQLLLVSVIVFLGGLIKDSPVLGMLSQE